MKIKTLLILLCLCGCLQSQPQFETTKITILANDMPVEDFYNSIFGSFQIPDSFIVITEMLIDIGDLTFSLSQTMLNDTLMGLIFDGTIEPRQAKIKEYRPIFNVRSILNRRGNSNIFDIDESIGAGPFVRKNIPHQGKFKDFIKGKKPQKKNI